MGVREELQQQIQNENFRKLQQLLSITEGSSAFANPYLAKGGTRNGQWTSYANHPYFIDPKAATWGFKWNNGKQDTATAHGRYMIRQKTWAGANRALGGNLTFSPQDQDLAMAYLVKTRGALPDVLSGNWQSVFKKLGSEWASLPTSPYAQHKFSNQGFVKALEKVGIDPRLAGYNGNFNVSQNPQLSTAQQYGTPQQNAQTSAMINALGGGGAVGPLGSPSLASQKDQAIPDIFAQQPQRVSNDGFAPMNGQTKTLGFDYLTHYFAGLNKRKQNNGF